MPGGERSLTWVILRDAFSEGGREGGRIVRKGLILLVEFGGREGKV